MHYVVDSANLIVDVDEDWDAEAERADCIDSAGRQSIIGRPLDAFMVGDATKMFVRSALEAARLLNDTQVLPYRCDSEDQHRRFEMVISPLGNGMLRVAHRLVEARPRGLRPQRRQRPQISGLAGWRCSQCLLVRFCGSSEWRETDLAPGALLAQDVCPTCAQRLFTPLHTESE